ncbi:MAG: bifunctional metallophosphatase/5'-nucleotidase [Clostridia bacterium]|nr:bifunctional metallophosphatase/5'-nucleotidase [Clostridia bacterium]
MQKILRVIFTADCHGYLYPSDYFGTQEERMGMLSVIAAFRRDENTLVIDGGDTIQGSPFTAYLRRSGIGPKPLAGLMNMAGYDYIALGNHDFDYGNGYLGEYLEALSAKCLCANIRDREFRLPVFSYSIHTMKNGLRVGLCGVCTEKLMRWEDRGVMDDLDIRDAVENAKNALDLLKGRTDVNICVYHGGFEFDPVTGKRLSSGTENRAELICSLGYDLVLCAHQHRSLPGKKIGSSWAVQVMNRGREFSVTDVTVDEGDIRIVSRSEKPGNEVFLAGKTSLDGIQKQVNEHLDRPIGAFSRPLEAEEHLVSACRGSDLANFFNMVQCEAALCDISACNLYNEVRGFEKTVTIRDVMKAYRFPNTLVVLRLTGTDIKNYLEQCARYFTLLETGEVVISREYLVPKAHHYHFDYLYGLAYVVDLSCREGDRVKKIVRLSDGSPIGEEDEADICFSSYRATGIGGFDMLRDKPIVREIPVPMQDLIIRYFESHPTVDPVVFSAVRFADRDRLFISPPSSETDRN